MKYFHAIDVNSSRGAARAAALRTRIGSFECSELGTKLFGLESW
jgi:hypothetical protein